MKPRASYVVLSSAITRVLLSAMIFETSSNTSIRRTLEGLFSQMMEASLGMLRKTSVALRPKNEGRSGEGILLITSECKTLETRCLQRANG